LVLEISSPIVLDRAFLHTTFRLLIKFIFRADSCHSR